ncbi:MAG: ATP-binding cassette domain-containing protein [Desulfobacteraceae bacterium]|jgi:ABC-2 type transport system ATP-binding protein
MIHIEGLTKYYNDFCAVDHISLDIRKGEIIGLLGPNGAGKTTTLRMLTGYFHPSSGSIRVKDFSVAENPLEVKKCIGYLPESAPLYHNMIVYDYLAYVADVWGFAEEGRISRIRKLSDLCGLQDIMHKTIGELSKGLKQRVGIAHAMMSDPEILILDEPTSGLDPNQIVEIRKIIKEIGKEKTIILSTHILSEAEATCDRIIIINKGKIVADGSTETIKRSQDTGNTINLSLKHGVFDTVDEKIKNIQGIKDVKRKPSDSEDILNIAVSCSNNMDLREDVYNVIKNNPWIILEFYQESTSLENIFRNLTMEN